MTAFCFLPFFLYSLLCFGSTEGRPTCFDQALYFGAIGGYGSTTWGGLVPNESNQNSAINLSTPIKVTEGGGVFGFLMGYEFIPAFAAELAYMHYPETSILFDESSLFSFENDNLTRLRSKTETVSLMGKVMLPLGNTCFRLFSSAGAATVHRHDFLVNHWRLSPTFGVGLNYPLGRHVMAEIAGNYTAGFGESQLNPTKSFFPFLYSVTGRLALRL